MKDDDVKTNNIWYENSVIVERRYRQDKIRTEKYE